MTKFDYKDIVEKISGGCENGSTICGMSITEELIKIQKLKIKRESLKKLLFEFINEIESNVKEEELYQKFKYFKTKYKIIKNWRISFGLLKFIESKGKVKEYEDIISFRKFGDGKEYYDIETIIELLKELKIFVSVKKDNDKKYVVIKR